MLRSLRVGLIVGFAWWMTAAGGAQLSNSIFPPVTYWYIGSASAYATSSPMQTFFTAYWRKTLYPVSAHTPPPGWTTIGSAYFQAYNYNFNDGVTNAHILHVCDTPSHCTGYLTSINKSGLTPQVLVLDEEIWKFSPTIDWSTYAGHWNCAGNTGSACAWQAATNYNCNGVTNDVVMDPNNTLVWKYVGAACSNSVTDPLNDVSGAWLPVVPDAPTLIATYVAFGALAHSYGYATMCTPTRGIFSNLMAAYGGTYPDSAAAFLSTGVVQAIAPACDFFDWQGQLQQNYLTPGSTTSKSFQGFLIGGAATWQNYVAQGQAQYRAGNVAGIYINGVTTTGSSSLQAAQAVWQYQQAQGYWFNVTNAASTTFLGSLCILSGVSPANDGSCTLPSPQPPQRY